MLFIVAPQLYRQLDVSTPSTGSHPGHPDQTPQTLGRLTPPLPCAWAAGVTYAKSCSATGKALANIRSDTNGHRPKPMCSVSASVTAGCRATTSASRRCAAERTSLASCSGARCSWRQLSLAYTCPAGGSERQCGACASHHSGCAARLRSRRSASSCSVPE